MRRRLLYLIAVTSLSAGLVLTVLALRGGDGDDDGPPLAIGTPLPTAVPRATATPQPTEEPTATPTATPAGDPRLAALDIHRLVIPSIGVDAPIITLGLLPDRTMDSPDGPEEVAWYTFSAKPGQIGNVVMAGHLDYINYGAAVFWRLEELRPGDEVQLVMEDGTLVKYAVESVIEYEETTAPVQDIVGPTPNEAITLITCAGSFDRTSRHYNQRLVVRGTRVIEAAESGPAAEGTPQPATHSQ